MDPQRGQDLRREVLEPSDSGRPHVPDSVPQPGDQVAATLVQEPPEPGQGAGDPAGQLTKEIDHGGDGVRGGPVEVTEELGGVNGEPADGFPSLDEDPDELRQDRDRDGDAFEEQLDEHTGDAKNRRQQYLE